MDVGEDSGVEGAAEGGAGGPQPDVGGGVLHGVGEDDRALDGIKESKRLERHCVRGVRRIGLHATMAALTFQATAVVRAKEGAIGDMRWTVRKVA